MQTPEDGPNLRKKIVDSLATAVVITDTSGVIQYANQTAADRSGFAVAEIIGKTPGKLWGGRMGRDFYDRFWGLLSTERLPFIGLIHNIRKNGSRTSEQLHAAPILDSSGKPSLYIKIQPPDGPLNERFSRDFSLKLTSGGSETLDFFKRFFDISDFGTSVPHPSDRLIAFFENELIAPTKERLRARSQDAILIAAAKNDAREFHALYQKYYTSIYQFILHRTGYNSELAADLTQDTFLQAYRYLARFTVSNASYGTYLIKIAHTVLAGHFRGHASVISEEISRFEHLAAPELESADIFDIAELKKVLLELSPIEQQILLMKYEKNLSVREIAEALAKTENAVKLHLSRAREKMRRSLQM